MAGSSPPAWGTPFISSERASLFRFIPTRVGNTLYFIRASIPIPVHPHPRGEHMPRIIMAWILLGSSPPAWGTRPQIRYIHACWRFIPTRVGNTVLRRSSLFSPAVHPHPRGEHPFPSRLDVFFFGSSPPAWGTLSTSNSCSHSGRFIPTRVGNTSGTPCSRICRTVHPHPRGEHFLRHFRL